MIDLKSIFRINMLNLSPLFNKDETLKEGLKNSSEVYEAIATPTIPKKPPKPPVDKYSRIPSTDFKNKVTVAPSINISPKSADSLTIKEVEKPLPIPETDNEQIILLTEIVKESENQTKLLNKIADPTDVLANDAEKEIKQETETQGHFDRLSQSIDKSQTESTNAIVESIEELGKNAAIGGTGTTDIIDDATDLLPGGKGKPKAKKSKRARVKGKGALKRMGNAAMSILPEAVAIGGTGAVLTGSAGAAFTGGVGTAAAATGGLLLSGGLGYGTGYLINKGVSAYTGRDDWLFGWMNDNKVEKENNERRKDSYTKFSKIASPEVLELLGGESNFDSTGILGLRSKGLIVYRGNKWFTKAEVDLQLVEDANEAIALAEQNTKAFPTHLLNTSYSDITAKDREKLKSLIREKEVLLSNYNETIIRDMLDTGYDTQIANLMNLYKKTEIAYAQAQDDQKEILKQELSEIENSIEDLSGSNRLDIEAMYKQKVSDKINKEFSAISKFEKFTPVTLSNEQIVQEQNKVIKQVKQERIDEIEQQIIQAQEKKQKATGFLNVRRINNEIRELESKKSNIENMTEEAYKDWLDAAIKDSSERLNDLKRKKSSMWSGMSQEQFRQAIPQAEIEMSNYKQEMDRIDAITKRRQLTFTAEETSNVSPAMKEIETQEKAKAERARKPVKETQQNQQPVIINNNNQSVVSGSNRSTRLDDAGTELLRTMISG